MNNMDKEHFLSFQTREDYSFKYIPESHFKHVVKTVQRQRRQEDQERIWASFVNTQELNCQRFDENDVRLSIGGVAGFLQENIQDVDRELKRLQDDALPEQNKRMYDPKSNIRNEVTRADANNVRNNVPKEKFSRKNENARCNDISIPVSRADNVPDRKESDGSRKVCRLRPKRSLSDPSITQKERLTSRLLRAANRFENNSDSDSSNNRDDIVRIQPDPVTIQKILSMQKRVTELLNEISFRLHRIPLPDGDNDMRRRQQQTMEFAIRFSRNYLYDLNRHLISIERHLGIISSRAGSKQRRKNIALYQDIIKQKIIAAHQLLIQALNAYCKHIPNSVLEGHSTKLQEVLQVVCNLRDICSKVEISTNCLCSGDANIWPEKDVQDKLDAILSELKQSLDCKHPRIRYRDVESTANVAQISSRSKRYSVKKSLSGRLSMYSVDAHKNNQKKRNALKGNNYCCQNDKKWNVVDAKSACSQHYSIPELLYPSPVTHTSSSRDIVQIDSAKSMNCSKDDDDIKTMMDRVPIDSETDKSSTGIWKVKSTEDNEAKINVENVTNDDDLIKKVTTITKEQLSTLVPVISDLMTHVSKTQNESNVQPLTETTVETLVEFLQKYQRPKDYDAKAKLTDEHSRIKLNGLSEIQKHEKNVRLIYVSSVDEVSKTDQCGASCQANYETGAESTDDRKAMGSVSKDATELTISRETELQFLAYRHEYKSLCRSKPMYSSNTQNKPWDIVAWISDKLIEELIIEITEELQMTDVIKKMFKMEFQEF